MHSFCSWAKFSQGLTCFFCNLLRLYSETCVFYRISCNSIELALWQLNFGSIYYLSVNELSLVYYIFCKFTIPSQNELLSYCESYFWQAQRFWSNAKFLKKFVKMRVDANFECDFSPKDSDRFFVLSLLFNFPFQLKRKR